MDIEDKQRWELPSLIHIFLNAFGHYLLPQMHRCVQDACVVAEDTQKFS